MCGTPFYKLNAKERTIILRKNSANTKFIPRKPKPLYFTIWVLSRIHNAFIIQLPAREKTPISIFSWQITGVTFWMGRGNMKQNSMYWKKY